MSKKHGRTTMVTINAVNISPHTRNTEWKRTGDKHDVTTYKATEADRSKEYIIGLTDGTVTISGVYDTDETTGPAQVLETLLDAGNAVPFIFQAEGTGAGKPQRSCNVVVETYNQTNPVADIVTWTSDLQITGMVDADPQSA